MLRALLVSAGVVLGIGALRPAPWLLAPLLVLVMSGTWIFAINRWLADGGSSPAGGPLPT